MDNKTKNQVFKVVERVTNRKVVDLNGDLKSQLNLDSIQLVELFAALEAELKIELPLEMMMISKANKFMERLEEEINNQTSN